MFAKSPVAGHVKTRLQPVCNAQQAAEIAKFLLGNTIEFACRSWPGEVVLALAGDPSEPFVQQLIVDHQLNWIKQEGADLGARMLCACRSVTTPAAVLGADVWLQDPRVLLSAYDHLLNGESVIAPALDGGYYLLGTAQPQPLLFSGINWGTDQVLSTTLDRFARLGIEPKLLAAAMDIDTPAELKKAADTSDSLKQLLVSIGVDHSRL